MVRLKRESEDKRPAKNYLGRREQKRLLLLVMTLGLVVILMFEAAKPKNWAWLWQGQPGGQTPPSSAGQSGEDYDTRVRPSGDSELPLDTFISPPDVEPEIDTTGKFFPGVIPDYLKSIRDHTVFRSAEHDAWYNLLGVLRDADEKELEAESIGDVGFVQLYEQPDQYRGKLVTLSGTVRRAFDMQSPKNDQDIQQYHQLWLRPSGGPTSPIVVYVLDLPESFPSSRGPDGSIIELGEDVTLTGFYYKNWAYKAGANIRSAPLVLAKSVDWTPPVEKTYALPRTEYILAGLAGTALFGIAIAVLINRISREGPAPGVRGLAARFQAESLNELDAADVEAEIEATLNALSQQDDLPAAEQNSARSEAATTHKPNQDNS